MSLRFFEGDGCREGAAAVVVVSFCFGSICWTFVQGSRETPGLVALAKDWMPGCGITPAPESLEEVRGIRDDFFFFLVSFLLLFLP